MPREPAEGTRVALALPCDVLKTPGLVYRPETTQFTLTPALHAEQDRFGGGQTIALAGLVALLHRYTQQTLISLGVIDHAGSLRELALRTDAFRTGHDLADQIALQMDRLPAWDDGVNERAAPQVTVALHPGKATIDSRPDLRLDLRLDLATPDSGALTYNSSLFFPDTIARLIGHWNTLTKAMVNNPACPIVKLPMLTTAETNQLLGDWRSAQVSYPQRPLFHEITQHALERPQVVAVSFKNQALSYGELEARSNRLAHYLREQGVGPGTRVAVCIEPSLDIALCLLGIFKAGGAYVPVDPTYPPERQTVILEDVKPRVLLTQSHLRSRLPPTPAQLLDMDSCFVPGSDGPLSRYPATAPNVAVHVDDVAFIVYTSGTTGKPKGVLLTHANLVNYIRVAQERYRFDRSHVQPAMARFSFSITMFELLAPLVAGGRLIVLERDHVLDFKRLVDTLEECTVLHASPSLLRKLVAYVRDEGIDLARLNGLRHVSTGGDLVSADLMEALKRTFRKAELFVIYGCSEIACMGSTYEIPREQIVTRSRVGKPFPNVTLRLLDPNGNLVPIGVAGEIYFGGAGLALGYLDRPELTQEKFVFIDGERFYRTGDVGRYGASGDVEMLGRSDFQIKLRGIRIELAEIEVTLRQAVGVREAVVSARNLGEEKALIAYVVLDASLNPDVKHIRRFLQAKLPDYMVPAVFVVLAALPVNMNQKVDRNALPMPTHEDLARLRTLVAPQGELEARLMAIWQELLETSAVGVEDSFFDVGGNSLLAVSLMIAIEKTLGKTLPLSTLLTESTISGLAKVLREPNQERSSVVLLKKGGTRAPIFFVHDGEGEIMPYRTLAMKLGREHPVYGIQPKSRGAYPMLHSRLSEVVDYCVEEVLRVQPRGPYFLSGLCIGGFIAFEMADRLKRMGHSIGMMALIDAAHVKAPAKSLTLQRLNRFSATVKQGHALGTKERALHLVRESSRKIRNAVVYEARTRLMKAQNHIKMRLFRAYLDQGWELPAFLAHIPVRVVLRFAEKEYVIPEPYDGEILLFRATHKSSAFDGTEIDDTPYIDLFEEAHLGWDGKTTKGFRLYDNPAGHSSMLQEPNVDQIAEAMQAYIDARIEAQPTTRLRPDVTEAARDLDAIFPLALALPGVG